MTKSKSQNDLLFQRRERDSNPSLHRVGMTVNSIQEIAVVIGSVLNESIRQYFCG
jgi:hypothetical protein